jgi:hypothetical protein
MTDDEIENMCLALQLVDTASRCDNDSGAEKAARIRDFEQAVDIIFCLASFAAVQLELRLGKEAAQRYIATQVWTPEHSRTGDGCAEPFDSATEFD